MAQIAFIGLGNMGGPMAANLVKAGHSVRAFDLVQAALDDFAKVGGVAVSSLERGGGAGGGAGTA